MKLFTTLTLLFLTLFVNAQNFNGQAFYESKTTMDMDFGGRQMSEEMKKSIADRMRKYLEKTYILTFNKTESMYKEEEMLDTDAAGGNRMMGMMMGSFSAGDQYKNIETKQLVEEREFYGKQFLVKEEITPLEWTQTKESKQIGQYVAFKATAIKTIDPNDLSMARRRRGGDRDAEKKEGEEAKDSTETKDADPFDEIEVPKEVIVTAWYTPMIPVGHGPGEYSGLPGLILELNVYRTTLLCSKIVMNPKESEEIKAPSKGKEVTREEYNAIVKEKMDEMREMFRNRGGGRRGGGGFRG